MSAWPEFIGCSRVRPCCRARARSWSWLEWTALSRRWSAGWYAAVIAVPTSVGYGAAFGGLAPLLTMLNSCAAGVTVVNIDNGFGAAMAVWRLVAHEAVEQSAFK
jgi:hypothetical protein